MRRRWKRKEGNCSSVGPRLGIPLAGRKAFSRAT
ncbi:hypothetical protein LINPERPRIM_LOCUS32661 [Linum perenne]